MVESAWQSGLHGSSEEGLSAEITTITLSLPLKLGVVNCYLVGTGTGYVLIDTGCANQRAWLETVLVSAGCQPGNLQMIVLTHGDFDHTGNGAYLRERYGAQIAMHRHDAGMAEHGDMFWNRSSGNRLLGWIATILFQFSPSNRFRPDVYVEDGDDLAAYGLEAQVLYLPGHSTGSIGILTADGDLFCGDLLENDEEPTVNSMMDDLAAGQASLDKLKDLPIKTVYPGHGQPFPLSQFMAAHGQ
jgi:glyoxylase-like metal-dependent hydrolase (beta-lactamase superfamily II)